MYLRNRNERVAERRRCIAARTIVFLTLVSVAALSVALVGVAAAESPTELTECTEIDESGAYVLTTDLV